MGSSCLGKTSCTKGPSRQVLILTPSARSRAQFLSDRGCGALHDLRDTFARRNATLAQLNRYEDIILWFEHDLYDQLQLIQILDYLAAHDREGIRISLICIDHYPGVRDFRGLGDLQPEHIPTLFDQRNPLTDAQMAVATTAWQAFQCEDPTSVEEVLGQDTAPLPFLHGALRRHLEQLPSSRNGLGQTELQALSDVASGIADPVALLKSHWAAEDRLFMGDWAYWAVLKELARGPRPLVLLRHPRDEPRFTHARVTVTEDRQAVLRGESDAIRLNGIDRWFGGVHLQGHEASWRWDTPSQRVRRCAPSD